MKQTLTIYLFSLSSLFLVSCGSSIESDTSKIIQGLIDSFTCKLEKRPVIKVLGVYDKKDGRIISISIKPKIVLSKYVKNPYEDINLSTVISEEKPEEYIRIQLKKKTNLKEHIIDERIIEISKFYPISTYPGHRETRNQNAIPISIDFFPPCDSFDKNNWFILIKEQKEGKNLRTIQKINIEWEDTTVKD